MSELILIFQTTLVYAAPLLIIALAGCFAERSGIINLALEGCMIFGAFAGALFVYIIQKSLLKAHTAVEVGKMLENYQQLLFIGAMVIAGIAGGLMSLLLSFASIKLKANQTIAGTAINLLAPALVLTICLVLAQQEKLVMPSMPKYVLKLDHPTNTPLDIFIDKVYISTYIIIAIYILASIWLYKSKIGTHMRACGEHPQAADSVGINVYKMRYLGTTISGIFSGIGGYAYIATVSAGTAESTVGGMGFLALAIMIFGNWNPLGIALGALLFGLLKCVGPLSSSIPFLARLDLPIYFYNILPYVIVIIVLIIFRSKSGCPKAEGIPYEKGQR